MTEEQIRADERNKVLQEVEEWAKEHTHDDRLIDFIKGRRK